MTPCSAPTGQASVPSQKNGPAGPAVVACACGCAHLRHRLGIDSGHLRVEVGRTLGEPSGQEAPWTLPPEPCSVPRARHLVRDWLAARGLDGQTEVAELLASELVTNALRHARGTIRLALFFEDGLLRCEVEDGNPALPRPGRAHEDDEGGRGLHLLELLSCCWGSAWTPMGKAVWFELPTHAIFKG
ncbi:ATP-binding protein [Streptosporangium sp. NBC_01639]|uniref:ATP-binding protein n=1 Tax=Streptosporangium sp. NBC_01639 TaxID=2975948 RepID=UPI0038644079|nr:ATP-binding protein [Streptosporangium sp. NBC_01639]